MKREEDSLLMFLEFVAVDQWGIIDDMRKVNAEDMEIIKRWNKEGFVSSKRVSRRRSTTPVGSGKIQLTYAVRLSDDAWKLAHQLRKEKALRHIPEELELEKESPCPKKSQPNVPSVDIMI